MRGTFYALSQAPTGIKTVNAGPRSRLLAIFPSRSAAQEFRNYFYPTSKTVKIVRVTVTSEV